jgi:hypothetical protein
MNQLVVVYYLREVFWLGRNFARTKLGLYVQKQRYLLTFVVSTQQASDCELLAFLGNRRGLSPEV